MLGMTHTTRPVSIVPPSVHVGRFVQALARARGSAESAAEIASAWRDSPHVSEIFRSKAAIAAGSTSTVGFAQELATFGLASSAMELLRGISIVSALAPSMRRVPFFTKIARESGAGAGGAWVAEGAATPIANTSYDSLSLPAYKAQTAVVVSNELIRMSTPAASTTLASTLIAGLAAYLDSQFLTSSVALVANQNPASVTNGASSVTSTGTTAAQISADLAALLAAVPVAEKLFWVMRPTTAGMISMKLAGAGMSTDLPRSLFSIPVIVSFNSPSQVTLIDAGSILYAADDNSGFDVELAQDGTVEMQTTPANPTTSATVLESLWQRDEIAIRVTRYTAWARARADSVAYMVTTY